MSDPRAVPDEERPFIPEESVARQEGDQDPMRADGTRADAEGIREPEDEDRDDSIDVEDLP